MASFEELEKLLEDASRLLDQAAKQIRDLDLEPQKNIRRIGEAVVLVSEIRSQIYRVLPELMPGYLRKP